MSTNTQAPPREAMVESQTPDLPVAILGPSPVPPILAAVSILLGLGLVMVLSTSWLGLDGEARDPTYFFRRQLVWVVLSFIGLLLAWTTDYRKLCRLAPWGMLLCLVLLVAVFVPGIGQPIRRVYRWIRIGGMQIQPSEMAKLLLPLCLAVRFGRWRREPDFLRDTLPALLAIGVVCCLIAVAPDFGTALFVGGLSVVLLFVAGVPLRQLFMVTVPALLVGFVLMASRFGHIMKRVEAFLEPEKHLQGTGYQIYQSLIALGSGGVHGRGLGAGHQKFLYLPDAHTDFIFSVLGEELGFVGTALVIALFASLLWAGIRVLRSCLDRRGFLMAFAVVFSLCLQAGVNVAVVTSSVPCKGISMPFLSFGGSSLFFTMCGLGLLLNIACVSRRELRRRGGAGTVPMGT